jgi:hypothetical protein
METGDATKEEPCARCGAPTPFHAGDEPICETCWQLAGACCSGE